MKFVRNPLKFFLGGCAFGFALGFVRYFNQWVYFSAFPNELDSIGMALIGTYLVYESLRKVRPLSAEFLEIPDIET